MNRLFRLYNKFPAINKFMYSKKVSWSSLQARCSSNLKHLITTVKPTVAQSKLESVASVLF